MRNLTDWKWIEGRLIRLSAGGGWELGGGQLRSLSSLSQLHSEDLRRRQTRPDICRPEMSFRPAVAGLSLEFICCWMVSRTAAPAIIVFLEILASCNCRLVSPSFLIIIRFLRSDNLPYPGPVSDTANLLYFPTKCKIFRSGGWRSLSSPLLSSGLSPQSSTLYF